MLTDKEFYQLHKKELISLLETSTKDGLTSRMIRRKQQEYGINRLPVTNGKGFFSIILNQFNDFMIMVLMIATLLSFIMGEIGDGTTIFAIIILNAIMGFIQEYRAEKSLAALKKLTAPRAKVLRDGKISEIDAAQLVPGDILLLESGDRIPADARILKAKGVEADESLLTGESVPVSKVEEHIYAPDLSPANQKNMLFMGTKITRGRGQAVVVNTGLNTEMGKIADLIDREQRSLTPLQKRLKHLGKWLVIISLIITLLIVAIGIIKGQSIYQMFLAGVSLAVAAIPEGLPAIVTLALALGVQRMINKKAIVRQLPAVETLGCATVICSDKTGTLTRNEMTLSKGYINNKINRLDGKQSEKGLKKMLEIGAMCNGARLKEEEKSGPFNMVKKIFTGGKTPDFIGDPTDIALVKAIYNYNLKLTDLREKYKVIGEEPFDPERKRMSVMVEKQDRGKELWVKGAPEKIIKLSKFIEINGQVKKMTPELEQEISRANDSMAQEALRVLAIGYRSFTGRVREDDIKVYEDNLTLVGLVGLIDPPREEAYEAVRSCYRAGIKPVMITGDHKLTARVIAEDLGIISRRDQVISGDELKGIDDKGLQRLVKKIQVYARVSPEDKLRIVRALKENGEVVAMTGDGVNDAPALKEADIGVAMGMKGTDVTREVSSLILADDNFATIVAAVEEGRKIYNNIRKFIRYLLACNIGELLAIFIGITVGLPIPLIPIQILWVNLVTDGLPALALGLDQDSDNVMDKPPRDPEESIFAHGMVSQIASQGFLIGISTMVAFLIAIYRMGVDINTARTMAFSTLVFSQLFFVFSCRSEEHVFWQLSPFTNLYLVGAVILSIIMQLAVIYLPLLSQFFRTSVLTREQWLVVIILSTWSTLILEFIRYLAKKLFKE